MKTKTTPTEQEPPTESKFLPEEQSRSFLTDFLGQEPVKKNPDTDVAEPPSQEQPQQVAAGVDQNPPAAPAPEVSKKKAKASNPEPEPAPASAPTAEEIATQVGKAVAREMRQSQLKDEPKPVIVVKDDVPAHELRLQSNLETLAKLYPEEYGNIHTERKQFVDKLRSYEKRWLDEHPGEEFDPNAEEHNDFYASDPMQKVSPEHLAEAIAEQRVNAKAHELEQRIKQSELARDVEPVAASTGAEAASGIVKELAPDLKLQFSKNGKVDPASYTAALEADPVKAPILADAAEAAHNITAEIVKIYTGVVKPDPAGNPKHASLLKFGAEMEQRMKTVKPSEWSDPKGRAVEDFLPSREYWSLPPAQRRNHWTFDQDDMVALAQADIRNDARKAIEFEENRVNSIISKRTGGNVPVKKESRHGGDEKSKITTPAPLKPTSPSGRGEPNLAGVTGGSAASKKSSEDSWLASYIGKD